MLLLAQTMHNVVCQIFVKHLRNLRRLRMIYNIFPTEDIKSLWKTFLTKVAWHWNCTR